ncbi:MAG: trypsin-like peptidase domain-containing protein [Thermoguttaceae bacterium]|nr:trypsin-like peptidase domain-containing protein [Thermoguttaceae bacterium]
MQIRCFVFTDAHLFQEFQHDLDHELMGVRLYDGTLLKPTRVAYDLRRDYLVMEFPLEDVSTKLKPLKFFNSARIQVGKTINYIKPSSEGVVSTGTIAPRDPLVKRFDQNPLITLDAQIERGCSGCPIVDENGYVYGFIKAFYYSEKPEYNGKSFAIRSNDFLEFAVQKFAGDRIRRS